MPLLVPDDFTIAAFTSRILGWSRDLVCTLGLNTLGAATVDTTFANNVFNIWKGAMDTSVTGNVTFVGVTLYWKKPLGFIPVPSNSATIVGTAGGTSLPPNTAVMVEKNTLRPGRAGKGRFYLPGFPEGGVDPNGTIVPANLTQVNNDLAALYTGLTSLAGISDLVLYHDTGVPSPGPTKIESLTADSRVSSISKRFKR